MNNRVIREYLESLKEDNELDYIFPILLESMGFRIVSTPRATKGQPQFGKDVVAIGPDESGKMHKWFFELKGAAARDITSETFNCQDGIRDSIQQAIDVDFPDCNIPSFKKLPLKIVIVHNGIVKGNFRVQYDAYVKKTVTNADFEDWDIDRLVSLFQKHLFDECLFRDEESYKLVKRILVFQDTPGWKTDDFEKLIKIQLDNCPTQKSKKRILSLHFSAINLMLAILYKEGITSNNLLYCKRAADVAVLKVWSWVLKNELERNRFILTAYSKMLQSQLLIYEAYLKKLLPLATQFKGLYMVNGMTTEKYLYPLRCYDFIGDVLYYYQASSYYIGVKKQRQKHLRYGVEVVKRIISCNTGFDVPLLDTNSIPFLCAIRFILDNGGTEEDQGFIGEWVLRIVNNIILRKRDDDMFPETYGNRHALAKSLFKKDSSYNDKSSLFLLNVVELLYAFGFSEFYKHLRKVIIDNDLNLQVAYPVESEDLEVMLFNHRLHNELSVEIGIALPEDMEEIKSTFKKKYRPIQLRTVSSPFPFLVMLAHLHYKTDWFPDYINLGFLEIQK